MNNKKKEQFFTNPKISDLLVRKITEFFSNSIYQRTIIEPSAGSGNFINSLINYGIKAENILAYEIDKSFSKNKLLMIKDYLLEDIPYNENNFIIGNPPFGKNGSLALKFLNKGLSESPYVALILPMSFKKYSKHKHVLQGAQLLWEIDLPENSFLVRNSQYDVNCVFQLWSNPKVKSFLPNKRILQSPKLKVEDFITYTYNNTPKTLKFFNKDKYQWDLAIIRQGFYDYSKIITKESELSTNRQYIFIKIINPIALSILKQIDFNKLSQKNTIIPGFSKSDLITAYLHVKSNFKLKKKDTNLNFDQLR
ncbi:hypothetical protein NPA08_00165 [Mycoplasmopsis citelli]|uniref:hypothetical protein n=1 Tax=Mycoplasmopsis citelli TaxID=171281 RepID=UPI0021153820|nr:hypothetical protein [Mycoplasmopsis citelli]UUD36156.1 hypothetical protein NPA08_04375 [Mycoplasmopsis citelli]UUD36244.1 hypothetical protein NPA08_00165 [Mycoplasmopsis citelli]